MRKLASIQKITNIRPIEGADKIEVADVLGWSVVVGKGEFQVGDLAVYFEIDSWLDATNPAFASFEPRFTTWNGKRGMRLKTIKLRKQISQGLLMPVNKFPEIMTPVKCTNGSGYEIDLTIGRDVTEILKIEKWEPAEEASSNNGQGGKTSTFPHFIFKSDQERVQNLGSQLVQHIDETFEVTIKLDGSSMTVYHLNDGSDYFEEHLARASKRKTGWWHWLREKLDWLRIGVNRSPAFVQGVCSRNIEVDKDGSSHFAVYARENGLFEALENLGLNIALQGELISPSIQGNYEKVAKPEFYVYNVFDIDNQRFMSPMARREIVATLGIAHVPVLDVARTFSCFPTTRDLVDAILAEAEGTGMNDGVKREGLVFKSNESDFSFKAISNSYLLKKEGK